MLLRTSVILCASRPSSFGVNILVLASGGSVKGLNRGLLAFLLADYEGG